MLAWMRRPLTATASTATPPGFAATFGPSPFGAGSSLGPLGCDDLIKLALLEQLGHRPQGQAQGRHSGPQTEGLLDGAGCTHFVLTEADAEPARFAVAALATGSLTTTALPSATSAAEATVLLALGAG